MINSKVKFYFYKKRQWKQYKTHWKDITEWASSGAWPWKGWIQREGKAVLFLGCTGSCSEEGAAGYKAEATNADPTRCKPCGDRQWWPTVLQSGGSLAHLSRAWWWRSLRFQKNILAFALAWDSQQVIYHSCREGCWLERNSSYKYTAFSASRPSLQGHHKPHTAGFSPKTAWPRVQSMESARWVCYCWNTLLRFYVKAATLCTDILFGVLILFYNLL